MAKSMFAFPLRLFSKVISPTKPPTSTPTPTAVQKRNPQVAGQKRRTPDEESDNDEHHPRKRLRSRGPSTSPVQDNEDDDSAVFSLGSTQVDQDRVLMPPPATPHRGQRDLTRSPLRPLPNPPYQTHRHDDDAISLTSTALAKKRADDMNEELMEERRRYVAAIQLPRNSGIWSQTERDLFFHLAYRGFEPLLPQNWMLDFGTLPISVFVHDDTSDLPLVQNVVDNQFRAARALRQLFEAGHDVRDRVYVSPGSHREKILEKTVKRYLKWALMDVGFRQSSKADYFPVHAVVTRRKGQTTLQTLENVAVKLQRLAERHQRARHIRPSIEIQTTDEVEADETRVIEDDDALPTLIGLVIISSVVAVVTLSPFSQPAAQSSPRIRQTASPQTSDPGAQSTHKGDCSPDSLRIIAELDFSQKDQDVWNALGVAIVAMQIRKEALRARAGLPHDDIDLLGGDKMSLAGSKLDEEFDDTFGSPPRIGMEDDPDL
ncbi:hypothetical protein LTR10_018897 [Elasticomyces elasticus]|uniref:R3H domain-containing protein n=1 Tax=Exophiala sideris TaxID=1016849 RepID=A0ABR0JIM8_9EURO|nr:hypothetical protein LTR10_018897 [Elasticomyces elasticus]KAK5034458.1 hypothetical protein LTS07_003379 [Exophiala sideris]KAK5042755.1 hypothetical protein LTR13_001603 [Exophiala sideris]KAK5065838.1 hypothetical protein LTR69_003388 [Exophiala sideris]KAK5185701.1 hypothetical protein LTR44_001750 [Eurotiomycetes sp. CCFEE 6388]